MGAVVLTIAVLVAALVIASGVWVAAVLAATMVRVRHPASSAERQALGEADS